MKKFARVSKLHYLIIAAVFTVLAFAPAAFAAKKEVIWYVAASMTKPAQAMVDKFNAENQDMEIVLNVGGSGELLSKITASKVGDFYTPASTSFLVKAKDAGVVTKETPLLQQLPVFGLSKSGVNKIKTFTDAAKPGLKVALGNPETMASGKTWVEMEKKMPEDIVKGIRANTQVEALNINQVQNYITTDVVDVGLIFDSMAKNNKIPYVEIPMEYNIAETSHLVQLNTSKNSQEDLDKVQKFIYDNFSIFENAGYTPAGEARTQGGL